MDLPQIQTEIALLLRQHTTCAEGKHVLCIIDSSLRLTHADRTIEAPKKIAMISVEQCKQGLTPQEWARIGNAAMRALTGKKPVQP